MKIFKQKGEISMKKKALLLLTCSAVLLTGCSGNRVSETVDKISDSISKEQGTPAATATAAPTSTPGPKETSLTPGGKGTIGDWRICVKKASVKTKINDGKYRQFKPGKGKSFVVVSVSAKNNGDKAQQLLPRVGLENKMISATLIHQDKDEYAPTELIAYNKDLAAETIQAGSAKNGIIAFEVPKKVAKQLKKMKLRIGTKTDYLVYTM